MVHHVATWCTTTWRQVPFHRPQRRAGAPDQQLSEVTTAPHRSGGLDSLLQTWTAGGPLVAFLPQIAGEGARIGARSRTAGSSKLIMLPKFAREKTVNDSSINPLRNHNYWLMVRHQNKNHALCKKAQETRHALQLAYRAIA